MKKMVFGIDRIAQEARVMNIQEGILMVQDEDRSPLHYQLFLNGPDNTPYQGYYFNLDIQFSKQYPFKPPKIRILNNIYHLNIIDGQLPFDVLQDQWHPARRLTDIIAMLKGILINPDEKLIKDDKQYDIYINDREQYMEYARQYTQTYATKIIE